MTPKQLLRTWTVVSLLVVLSMVACRRDRQPQPPASSPTSPAATETPAEQATTAQSRPSQATPSATPEELTFLPLAPNGATRQPTVQPTATPSPTPDTTPTPTPPPFPAYDGPTLDGGRIGVQVHLHREELNPILNHVSNLGAGWVKVQVAWKVYQPQPDAYDDWRLRELDHLVSGSAGRGLKVLLSVAKAPEWSRPTTEMDGPPSDFAQFREFMTYLAARYEGNVAAYELWNEPNLQREWNGAPLSAAAFVRLVQEGAAGVRAGDSQALIISGAPATTGVNDGVVAIDDRSYLRAMVAEGVGDLVDGIGVHPYGWANPPGASAADAEQVAPTHNNHGSFFFSDTLSQYRAILEESGYGHLPLWLTEFGWGSFEGMGASPPSEAQFMAHVSEWQQAQYLQEALALVHDWPGVGPVFLWNLNFAPVIGAGFSESGYSLLRPDGSLRPVYLALQHIPKQ
ncbi:MAG: cellulase family glycosylhydrolase [Chloroflexota bacterium]